MAAGGCPPAAPTVPGVLDSATRLLGQRARCSTRWCAPARWENVPTPWCAESTLRGATVRVRSPVPGVARTQSAGTGWCHCWFGVRLGTEHDDPRIRFPGTRVHFSPRIFRSLRERVDQRTFRALGGRMGAPDRMAASQRHVDLQLDGTTRIGGARRRRASVDGRPWAVSGCPPYRVRGRQSRFETGYPGLPTVRRGETQSSSPSRPTTSPSADDKRRDADSDCPPAPRPSNRRRVPS